MGRLIFYIAVVVVIYWLIKSQRKQPPQNSAPETSEDMVRCSQCGVHLPKSESILAGGKFYCSEAHRREYNERKQ